MSNIIWKAVILEHAGFQDNSLTIKNNTPLVSICVTAYNHQKYITATIQSVLQQTYDNFELIIVDDCSTDNTAEVIKGFVDIRISYHRNEQNLGPQENWTKILGLARGKYVKLFCGDDILYPDCISEQVGVLEDPDNKNVFWSPATKIS